MDGLALVLGLELVWLVGLEVGDKVNRGKDGLPFKLAGKATFGDCCWFAC